MEHRSCYKNKTHSFIHVIEAITKKKYKEKSLWKVSSPNKTDCVNLLIFFPERTQEERTKKIQNKLKYRNKKFFFLPCSHLSPMKPTLHIKQMYLLLVNSLTQVMF